MSPAILGAESKKDEGCVGRRAGGFQDHAAAPARRRHTRAARAAVPSRLATRCWGAARSTKCDAVVKAAVRTTATPSSRRP